MTLVAWVLLIPFGVIGLKFLIAFLLNGTMNIPSALFMVFCLIIVALCVGYLWGGLDVYFK